MRTYTQVYICKEKKKILTIRLKQYTEKEDDLMNSIIKPLKKAGYTVEILQPEENKQN